MQGKLVFSHSRSTFFLAKRVSIRALRQQSAEPRTIQEGGQPASEVAPDYSLLRKGEIGLTRAGDVNRLGLRFQSFMPGDDVVLAIRHVVDLEVAVSVCLSKVGRRADYDVALHLRMHIAEKRNNARRAEGEGPLLPLGPSPKIVPLLLVSADGWPKNIMLNPAARPLRVE